MHNLSVAFSAVDVTTPFVFPSFTWRVEALVSVSMQEALAAQMLSSARTLRRDEPVTISYAMTLT